MEPQPASVRARRRYDLRVNERIPLLVDVDTGIDDALALLYASPRLRVISSR